VVRNLAVALVFSASALNGFAKKQQMDLQPFEVAYSTYSAEDGHIYMKLTNGGRVYFTEETCFINCSQEYLAPPGIELQGEFKSRSEYIEIYLKVGEKEKKLYWLKVLQVTALPID
jgi:hypothetical protein